MLCRLIPSKIPLSSQSSNDENGNAPAAAKYFEDDAEISDYAKKAVFALGGADIIKGRGNNMFVPKATITRFEAVQLIYNAFLKEER